jgi:hypothetical protein
MCCAVLCCAVLCCAVLVLFLCCAVLVSWQAASLLLKSNIAVYQAGQPRWCVTNFPAGVMGTAAGDAGWTRGAEGGGGVAPALHQVARICPCLLDYKHVA